MESAFRPQGRIAGCEPPKKDAKEVHEKWLYAGGSGRDGNDGGDLHPLIRGLVGSLPPPGSDWTDACARSIDHRARAASSNRSIKRILGFGIGVTLD